MSRPISWNRIKNSELLGMTLIEVLLVFIFAFLLVLNVFYRDQAKANAQLGQLDDIAEVVEEIGANLIESDENDGAARQRIARDQDIAGLVLAKLNRIDAALDRFNKLAQFHKADVWDRIQRYGGVENALAMLERTEREASQEARENDRLRAAVNAAGIDVPDVPIGGAGDQPGNCWYSDRVSKKGDQYLLHVTIHENQLAIRRAWPNDREQEVQQAVFQPIVNAVPTTLSYEQFMHLAKPLFEYSKSENCRFYVRVDEQAQSKEGFLAGLRAVEERFYKLAENF